MPIEALCPAESCTGLSWFYITSQKPYFPLFYASEGVFLLLFLDFLGYFGFWVGFFRFLVLGIFRVFCGVFLFKETNNNHFYFEKWERFLKAFSNKRHWKRSLSSGLLLVSARGASQSMTGTRKLQFLCSGISKNSLRIFSHKLWIWFNRNYLLISLFCQCWDCSRALLFLL